MLVAFAVSAIAIAAVMMTLNANLVGKKTIEVAIKHGFVDPACVLLIGEVPHAQMARMI